MTKIQTHLNSQEKRLFRSKCLKFTLILTQNLDINSKTRDEILFLTDFLLSYHNYDVPYPELLCVSCLVFILKFENDFNHKFIFFMNYVRGDLKISMDDLMKYEILILNVLPAYFIQVPSFGSVVNAFLSVLNKKNVPKSLADSIEQYCLQAYVESQNSLNFSNLFVEPVLGLAFDGSEIHTNYDLLRAVFVSNGISVEDGSSN